MSRFIRTWVKCPFCGKQHSISFSATGDQGNSERFAKCPHCEEVYYLKGGVIVQVDEVSKTPITEYPPIKRGAICVLT